MGKTWSDETLPQKVEYSIEDHVISGKQKLWKKIIEWIFTTLGWVIMLSYLVYIIYGMFAVKYNLYLPEIGIYTRDMITETEKYFYILFIAALIVTALLIIWKNYNKKRFGNLHRRKFRAPVDNSELMEMFQIDEELLNHLQNEKITVLETNIIPEELGMKYKNKNYEENSQAKKENDE